MAALEDKKQLKPTWRANSEIHVKWPHRLTRAVLANDMDLMEGYSWESGHEAGQCLLCRNERSSGFASKL